ncbi:MAG TPA: cobalamin-binding protein, partial [Candidatus Binataceae bacterium]|nr:cobalamin-binding protein [Candidatus Binataceae bacterium]
MPHRIVTLLPSATEIVCALGFEEQIVGRSHECDYPAAVKRLPALTEPKFKPEGTSAEIDERVKSIVRDALSVYRVDAGKLRELHPDTIVTQSQCEVCAVSESDVEAAVSEWIGTRPRIVSLAPYSLDDVFADMQRVGEALGAMERGAKLVHDLQARCASIAAKAAQLAKRPTIACIEWIDPMMAAGNWMPELVAMAGGTNLFGTAGEHSPWMKFDELAAADPDVILIAPCGFAMPRTFEELPELQKDPRWTRLGAVRGGKAFVA